MALNSSMENTLNTQILLNEDIIYKGELSGLSYI